MDRLKFCVRYSNVRRGERFLLILPWSVRHFLRPKRFRNLNQILNFNKIILDIFNLKTLFKIRLTILYKFKPLFIYVWFVLTHTEIDFVEFLPSHQLIRNFPPHVFTKNKIYQPAKAGNLCFKYLVEIISEWAFSIYYIFSYFDEILRINSRSIMYIKCIL